jgi:hypothetical protein
VQSAQLISENGRRQERDLNLKVISESYIGRRTDVRIVMLYCVKRSRLNLVSGVLRNFLILLIENVRLDTVIGAVGDA